mmetsp:Transcript_35581/g.109178  ORF Transcript_35581/g.109178 Transcript_35581/m.109178 type:complete len:229 (-) Transcript_35581:181-867(-)
MRFRRVDLPRDGRHVHDFQRVDRRVLVGLLLVVLDDLLQVGDLGVEGLDVFFRDDEDLLVFTKRVAHEPVVADNIFRKTQVAPVRLGEEARVGVDRRLLEALVVRLQKGPLQLVGRRVDPRVGQRDAHAQLEPPVDRARLEPLVLHEDLDLLSRVVADVVDDVLGARAQNAPDRRALLLQARLAPRHLLRRQALLVLRRVGRGVLRRAVARIWHAEWPRDRRRRRRAR